MNAQLKERCEALRASVKDVRVQTDEGAVVRERLLFFAACIESGMAPDMAQGLIVGRPSGAEVGFLLGS